MPRVGRVMTDPQAGAYCPLTLDRGEKVVVNQARGDFKGGLLSIETTKFIGFASDRIFACNPDNPKRESVLAWLTRGAEPSSPAATPLAAAVEFVKDAGTLAELRTRCAAMMSDR